MMYKILSYFIAQYHNLTADVTYDCDAFLLWWKNDIS